MGMRIRIRIRIRVVNNKTIRVMITGIRVIIMRIKE
jgi:hypothetical protein